jgi:predicted RNA binding protein YcfA (HicA-like mRNA interferase family)
MARLYSSRHIIKILEAHGFIFISQKGSHKKFRKIPGLLLFQTPGKKFLWGLFIPF